MLFHVSSAHHRKLHMQRLNQSNNQLAFYIWQSEREQLQFGLCDVSAILYALVFFREDHVPFHPHRVVPSEVK